MRQNAFTLQAGRVEQGLQRPAEDHGLLYGNALFETLPVWEGRPLLARRHVRRLLAGAVQLGWSQLPEEPELLRLLQEAAAAQGKGRWALRLTVSRGQGPPVPDEAVCGPPAAWVFARPWQAAAPSWTLAWSSIRRNPYSPLCQVKSANYLDSLLARQEARSQGMDEALLLNVHGRVAEGSCTNLFCLCQEGLVTPAATEGLLPGIAREVVLQVAAEAGLPCFQRPLLPAEVTGAREVFLTNSLLGVQPVRALAGRTLPLGPVTERLRRSCEKRLLLFEEP